MNPDDRDRPSPTPPAIQVMAPDDRPPAWSAAEEAFDALLRASHTAGGHDLPALVARHAEGLGVTDALIYLTDLQQSLLVPFVGAAHRPAGECLVPLGVDSTVAGRAFQHMQVTSQVQGSSDDEPDDEADTRLWIPLLDGTVRLGVLAVTVPGQGKAETYDEVLLRRLQRFATVVAELVMSKSDYGDTIVRVRRTGNMGLAAEIQWSLLPPLAFADRAVTVTAGLEPAYEVAGDSVDYAVDTGIARAAVFDGMGHGLASAQLVSLAVAAYRNARRGGHTLLQCAEQIESAVSATFGGEAYSTGLLAELDTTAGQLSWVSSGHLEPLLLREGRLVKSLSVEPSVPFGLGSIVADGAAERSIGSEHLQPGDLVLLYTDGVTEARSPDGEFFGQERMVDLLVRNLAAGLPPSETLRRVVQALLAHQSGNLDDDATMCLMQWHGPSGRHDVPESRRGRADGPGGG